MSNFKQYNLPSEKKTGLENFEQVGGRTILKEGEFTSPNFREGQVGWRLTSEGDLELNGGNLRVGTMGGQRVEILGSTSTIDFYDSGGGLAGKLQGFTEAGTKYLLLNNTGGYIIGDDNGGEVLFSPSIKPNADNNTISIGLEDASFNGVYVGRVSLIDGITAPGTVAGQAQIYVDTADGDLKVKFGDGITKTLATDS